MKKPKKLTKPKKQKVRVVVLYGEGNINCAAKCD